MDRDTGLLNSSPLFPSLQGKKCTTNFQLRFLLWIMETSVAAETSETKSLGTSFCNDVLGFVIHYGI